MIKCLVLEERSEFGGVNKVIRTLLSGNISENIVLKTCFLYKGWMPDRMIEEKSDFINKKTASSSRSFRYFRFFTVDVFKTWWYINKEKPDVIISFGSLSYLHIIFIRLLTNYKIIVSERADPNTIRSFGLKLIRYLYRYADKVVFQTNAAKSYFSNEIKKKSVVIFNPVIIPSEKWDKTSKGRIVTIGRLEIVQKRQDILIEAFSELIQRHPYYILEIWGDGPDKQYLQELSKELGLDKCILFGGYTSNVKEKLLNCDMFILSSDYEGQPNALLEAMALGVPSISTSYSPGGVEDIIGPDEGLIVPRGDRMLLAESIEKFIDDIQYAELCGENARKKMQLFSMDLVSKKWGEAIESVC